MSNGPSGVFIPIVTPFKDGEIDYVSYKSLVEHYMANHVDGIIPLGTTGEVPTIEDDEYVRVLELTVEVVNRRTSVFAGISGNSTRKVLRTVHKVEKYPINGYLVTAPYYNLPSQQGIYDHFRTISESTEHDILMYNIPYRTGRNMENETTLKLAQLRNIVGIKDSSGNISQTIELIRDRERDFSVLTGDDILYYFNLVSGGSGGILASAHLKTEVFVEILRLIRANDHRSALSRWEPLSRMIPLLFKEPNPAPIKYILARKGNIASEELRLPLTGITSSLKVTLDKLIEANAI